MNVKEYMSRNRRSSGQRNEFYWALLLLDAKISSLPTRVLLRNAELREAQEKVIFRQRIRASQSSAFRFIWAFFVWTHPYVDCYKRIGL